MAINATGVLRIILDYPNIFFDMMDYAEANPDLGDEEFSVSYYNHVLGKTLDGLKDPERYRVADGLQLRNLLHAGLLDYDDEKRDRFLLKPFVIEMLRHLDRSRLKELSDSDLESLRVQLQHAKSALMAPGLHWDAGNPEFNETLAMVLSTLRNVLSRIKQNVEALRGQSVKLAELAEEAEGQSRTQQLSVTLERIYQINVRHIEPTALFLNPKADWKGAGNQAPVEIIGDIVHELHRRRQFGAYGTANMAYLSILGYINPVTEIRSGLDTYLQLYDHQRKLYNRIEERYNDLLERVQAMHDGKQKYRLKASDDHFYNARCLRGMKDYRAGVGSRINWPGDAIADHFREYLRIRLERYADTRKSLNDVEFDGELTAARNESSQRIDKIAEVAKHIQLQPQTDIYAQIHATLSEKLDGYTLPELLEAFQMTPKKGVAVLLQNRREIVADGLKMTYFERHTVEEDGEHHG